MPTERSKRKVLLVDDDPRLHQIHKIYLQRNGYQLLSAHDGRQGLEVARNEQPDIILLDYMMPSFSGAQFLDAIYNPAHEEPESSFASLQGIPIVMLTAASHNESDIEEWLNNGLNAYLRKPFGSKELLNVLQNIFVKHKQAVSEKQFIESLRTYQVFYQMVLTNFPGILFTTDVEGLLTYFTEGQTHLSGYSYPDVVGKSVFELFDMEPSNCRELLSDLENHLSVNQQDALLLNSESQSIEVELFLSQLRDNESELVGILGIARDLSVIRRLESEKLEKERVAAIAQAMATVNHEINNPLTPLLGQLQLILEDEEVSRLSVAVRQKLETAQLHAERIKGAVQKMRSLSKPIFKEYYNGEKIIDLDQSL